MAKRETFVYVLVGCKMNGAKEPIAAFKTEQQAEAALAELTEKRRLRQVLFERAMRNRELWKQWEGTSFPGSDADSLRVIPVKYGL